MMAMKETTRVQVVALILAVLSCASIHVQGDYLFEVRIHRYHNPTHKRFDGRCCDIEGFHDCEEDPCDNTFVFCLRPPGSSDNLDSGECPLGSYTSGIVGPDSDDIVFGENDVQFDEHIPNPLVFVGTEWPGGFQLLARVDDHDPDGVGDFVDIISVEDVAVTDQFTPQLAFRGDNGYGFLRTSFRVTCTWGYSGPNCTTYCGVEGCSPQRASCGDLGKCHCYEGYTGDNCTIDLDPCGHTAPCQNGACVNLGPNNYECQCVAGFEGRNCELMGTHHTELTTTTTGILLRVTPTEPAGNRVGQGEFKDKTGVIVGAVVGGVVMIVFVAVVVALCLACKLRKRKKKEEETSLTESTKEQSMPGDNPVYTGTIGRHIEPSDSSASIYNPSYVSNDSVYHQLDNPLYGTINYEPEDAAPAPPRQRREEVMSRSEGSTPLQYDYVFHTQRKSVSEASESADEREPLTTRSNNYDVIRPEYIYEQLP